MRNRFVAGAIGLFTGACYGLALAVVIACLGPSFPTGVIPIAGVVFAIFGFIFGNVVEDALLALLHFLWGLLAGWFGSPKMLETEDLAGQFGSYLLLGCGTGIVLFVWHFQ